MDIDKPNAIEIKELKCADEAMVAAITSLLSQLTSSPIVFTLSSLQDIVESDGTHLYIARYGDEVVGMLSLCNYLAPTGRKMWIEDVVVDRSVRGKGVGRALLDYAIAEARHRGGLLMLTSRPSRVAANALYSSSGFERKETNVYKMDLD